MRAQSVLIADYDPMIAKGLHVRLEALGHHPVRHGRPVTADAPSVNPRELTRAALGDELEQSIPSIRGVRGSVSVAQVPPPGSLGAPVCGCSSREPPSDWAIP